jgi:hypothetical protein
MYIQFKTNIEKSTRVITPVLCVNLEPADRKKRLTVSSAVINKDCAKKCRSYVKHTDMLLNLKGA